MGASRWVRSRCSGIAWGSRPCSAASGAGAQGMVKNTYGDWQMRCETPAGATAEQCALVQNVVAEDRPNVTLVIIVLKTADGKSRLLRVVAPLGILLPSGLGLKIDQTDIGRAGFVRCLATGCVAEVVMEDNLDQPDEDRPDGHLHRVPDAGGGDRDPRVPERVCGRVRRPAVRQMKKRLGAIMRR